MKVAVIDIGSNTIKCDIFLVKGQDFTQLSAASMRGALAKHTASGHLTEEGYGVLKTILARFISDAQSASCDKIFVFATQSLRNIDNAKQVCDNIKRDLGVEIDIISGEDEAKYSFSALQMSLNSAEESGIMADMGGGSLELVEFENGCIKSLCSLPLGALRVAENMGVAPILNIEETEKVYRHAISYLAPSPIGKQKNIYIIGGTARSIFSLLFPDTDEISASDAKTAYIKLQVSPESSLQIIKRTLPKRYDSFMAGFNVFCAVCDYFGCEKIILCKQGVRDGYLKAQLEK